MDMLKGAALIAAFIGFLTIIAMWVSLLGQCVARVGGTHQGEHLHRPHVPLSLPISFMVLMVD